MATLNPPAGATEGQEYVLGDKKWVFTNGKWIPDARGTNASDASLRDRATHTGSQAISTVTGLQSALDGKVSSNNPTFTGAVSGVTKAHVGLGNVDNTTDASKPISSATQSALNAKAPLASPAFTGTVTGVTKAMVGLPNVDNTADISKPVSTATQAALDAKMSRPTITYVDTTYPATFATGNEYAVNSGGAAFTCVFPAATASAVNDRFTIYNYQNTWSLARCTINVGVNTQVNGPNGTNLIGSNTIVLDSNAAQKIEFVCYAKVGSTAYWVMTVA